MIFHFQVQVLEVLEAMVRIPLGAVELVSQHNLLTVLSAVLSTDIHDLPTSKSSHMLLLSTAVRVLNALWKTVFDSTTRKDIIASDPPEELLPELEDASSAKRKMNSETSEISPKRIKVDSKSYSGSENFHAELVEERERSEDSNAPVQKLLPPLFIHEFLNTVMLLLPVIIANCPPTTLASYLKLVSEVVRYVEKIMESSSEKQKIRLAALAPEILKEQVSEI